MLEKVAWYLEVPEGHKNREGEGAPLIDCLFLLLFSFLYVPEKSGVHGPSGPHSSGVPGIFVGFSF